MKFNEILLIIAAAPIQKLPNPTIEFLINFPFKVNPTIKPSPLKKKKFPKS